MSDISKHQSDHLMEMGWTQTKTGMWIDPETGGICGSHQAVVTQAARDEAAVEAMEGGPL